MNTVTSLCAASTVAVATCGLALATPSLEPETSTPARTAQKTARPSTARSSFFGSRRKRKGGGIGGIGGGVGGGVGGGGVGGGSGGVGGGGGGGRGRESCPPELPRSRTEEDVLADHGRPSTSRKWFGRLSLNTAPPQDPIIASSGRTSRASLSLRAGSRAMAARPVSSRSTGNKLVKRERQLGSVRSTFSRSDSPPPPLPSPSKRQSTDAGGHANQPPRREENSSSFSIPPPPRPATSGQEALLQTPFEDAEPRITWRPYFSRAPKRTPGTPNKLQKRNISIRRILPEFLQQRPWPTLVLASKVTGPAAAELGEQSRSNAPVDTPTSSGCPVSHMESQTVQRRQYDRGSTPPPILTPERRNERRSFSLSNFLGIPTPINSPSGKDADDESRVGFVGLSVANRRSFFSSSPPKDGNSPYQQHRPTTPGEEPRPELLLPPIQSLSALELSLGGVESDMLRTHAQQSHTVASSILEPQSPTNSLDSPQQTRRPNRLSVMSSAAELASTCVGSGASDFEFGSDTVFDSMRTRTTTDTDSVQLQDMFKFDGKHCEQSANRTRSTEFGGALPLTTPEHNSKRSLPIDECSEESVKTAKLQAGPVQTSNLESDDEEWSSDWDVASKSPDDDRGCNNPGGLRPFSGLLAPSRNPSATYSNKESDASFNTAPEGLAVRGADPRESSSILDWNDGASVHTSSSAGNSVFRRKMTHEKEGFRNSFGRPARRLPSHGRSQTAPSVQTIRLPLPSENWDDDFLADNDEADGFAEMRIPSSIQKQQVDLRTDRVCVREFSELVEDLKKLRDQAIANNMRYSASSRHLWDEVDGIIALATPEDPQETAPLKKDRSNRQHGRGSAPSMRRRATHGSGEPDAASYVVGRRRNSVLPPEDEIFGAGHSLPAESQPRTASITSSPSVASWVSADQNDPIEVAKNVIAKLRNNMRSQENLAPPGEFPHRMEFDKGMLCELVVHGGQLKAELSRVLEKRGSNRSLRLAVRQSDSHGSLDDYGFDVSPIPSIDENMSGSGVNLSPQTTLDYNNRTVSVGLA